MLPSLAAPHHNPADIQGDDHVSPIDPNVSKLNSAGRLSMSTPIDRSSFPNSVSDYAPKERSPARLGEVSDVAAVLLADRTATTFLRGASEEYQEGQARRRRRARLSLDPDFPLAPPSSVARPWRAVGRLAIFKLAGALVAVIVVGALPFIALWQHRPAVSPKQIERAIPRLLVQESRGTTGEPAPLGVTLQGRADNGVVMITGLIADMTLSTGSAVGAAAWQVPATQEVLGNTWIIPPKDFAGVVDLLAELHLADTSIAHRRPIHLEWATARPPVAAATPARETQRPAAALPRQPVQRQLEPEEIAVLVKRGKDFIAAGDLAAARIMLQRAAEARDADAALALAATYDPVILRELKVYGIAADVAMARTWYDKAKEFGSAEASRLLEILASATR
jgi:hypothetical protein